MNAPPSASNSGDGSIRTTLPSSEDWQSAIVEPHESPALERLFRRRTGLAPEVVPYVAPHSWAYRPFLFLMNPELEALDAQLSTQICFVVARDNACRFCYGSFRSFLRVAGFSETGLDQLEGDLYLNEKEGAKREALQFAVEISQGDLQQDTSVATLRAAGYGDTPIREIAGIAVASTLIDRMATMLAVPLNEDAETLTGQWFFDFLQPVVRVLLHNWQRLAPPDAPPLRGEEVEGPFAPWIRQLRDTCVGRVVHDIAIRWVDRDSALPLRTKLFILAVVARGLHSDALKEQAGTLLAECCDVSPHEFEAVVDHLRGSAVTDRDAGLLRLARESIRYEAGRIQATVREHVRDLSRSEIIDAVATFGVSNALARLRALAPLDD
jgi:AhpD family alkylhydroperoxidase